MSYDSKCHYLAGIFLGDEPHLHTEQRIDELAQIIQNAIESYIASERDSYKDAFGRGFAANRQPPITSGE